MDSVIILSILLRFVAIAWSIYLLLKLRDWRVAFLTLMFGFMALRQVLTVKNSFDGWYLHFTSHTDEIPGLVVSVLILVIVITFEKIIEDQKLKEKKLFEKSSLLGLYKDFFNSATSGIFIYDEQGKLTDINEAACKMHGFTREEMLNMSPKEFIHPDSHHVFSEFIVTAERGENYHGFAQGIRKNGGVFEAEVYGNLTMAGDRKYYFSSVIDVTEKIKAEKNLQQSEEKYRSIVETTDEWIWELDMEGRHIYSNNAIEKMLGYEAKEILEKDAFLYMDPDSVLPVRKIYEECVKNKVGWNGLVIAWKHKNGTVRYFESNAVPVFDKNDVMVGFRGADRDVTERREVDSKLRLSEERYRLLYDGNPSMFFTLDSSGIILSVNKFGAEQLGYNTEELVGKSVEFLFYKDDRERAKDFIEACQLNPDSIHRWELRKVRKDGSVIWVRETARIIKDSENNPNIFVVCEDFSDTHLLSEQLTYQASHDALTGLINRREFEIRLSRILETSRMQQTEHALCYLDLDQFKVINDACGHMAGDELLRQISQVLTKRIRKRDTLARLGGDEFGVLMEHCNMDQAEKVASGILHEVEQYRFEWGSQTYTIGVSIGLVPVNEAILDKTEVLREADAACYAAKDAGRNRVHLYSPDDIDLARRHGEIQWIARINKALENNNFILYAQPIVPTKNRKRKAKHYEILLRLKEGSNSEIISPTAFLPAAERYNLVTRVDKWVINNTIDFLVSHPDILQNIDLCSINLSGKSLADDAFLDFIVEKIKQTDMLARKLCFEITETAVIANLMRATLFIRKLQVLGCRFSLDDFGSGLSSFAYLKTLPVDFLKIDGLFVKDIVDDETDYAMVKSINDIGHVMGIKTIAEFVENDQINKKLSDIGVDYSQGYGIGIPEPLENFFNVYKTQPQKLTN